jgi:uncharacterized protein (DUF427 family)
MPVTARRVGRRHEMTETRIERGAKRVRAVLGGEVVADTIRPVLVWEVPQYPTYYLPAEDVQTERVPSRAVRHGKQLEQLRGLVKLDWHSMDAWFEEDEEVFTHPRDPYTRVDILPSSRHVRVELDGHVVAESASPRLLFETGLPTRYYLPKPHVRMDLLTPTATESHCPYKGQAEYWSFGAGHPDIAWSYRTPLPESEKVAGLVAFYDERADVFVDGVLQERPVTKFS